MERKDADARSKHAFATCMLSMKRCAGCSMSLVVAAAAAVVVVEVLDVFT